MIDSPSRRIKSTIGRVGLCLSIGIVCLAGSWTGSALAATPDPDPLAVPEAARSWVRERVGNSGRPRARLQRLTLALESFGMRQIDEQTPTAAEAFVERRADCVAYAHLFVALAREVDVEAYFVLFDRPASFSGNNGVRIAVNHMAAAYGSPGNVTVYDHGGARSPAPATFRRVSDATASAVFWSNRGLEWLLADCPDLALPLLDRATELDPQLAMAWTHLGVARRRAGDINGAESAYRRAIRTDPESVAAWRNLAILLSQPR